MRCQTCVRDPAARCAQALSETSALLKQRAQGRPGAGWHPRSRVQDVHKSAHTSIQVQRKHSGIPCAMALRLMPCSPRRRIRLVTVIDGLNGAVRPGWAHNSSADLTPATGARTTRFCRTHQRRSSARLSIAHGFDPPCDPLARLTLPRPPQPVPTFVTMANAPLSRDGIPNDVK